LATITGLQHVHPSKVIDPDNEDPEFFDDFTRVIDDAALKHADEQGDTIEVTSDNYIGMEMAMTRGSEGEMVHAKVRKRLLDEDGKPIGRTRY
jgi:hypothetical protein